MGGASESMTPFDAAPVSGAPAVHRRPPREPTSEVSSVVLYTTSCLSYVREYVRNVPTLAFVLVSGLMMTCLAKFQGTHSVVVFPVMSWHDDVAAWFCDTLTAPAPVAISTITLLFHLHILRGAATSCQW